MVTLSAPTPYSGMPRQPPGTMKTSREFLRGIWARRHPPYCASFTNGSKAGAWSIGAPKACPEWTKRFRPPTRQRVHLATRISR